MKLLSPSFLVLGLCAARLPFLARCLITSVAIRQSCPLSATHQKCRARNVLQGLRFTRNRTNTCRQASPLIIYCLVDADQALAHPSTMSAYDLPMAHGETRTCLVAGEDRTHDLRIMRPTRCQLRYCHLADSIRMQLHKLYAYIASSGEHRMGRCYLQQTWLPHLREVMHVVLVLACAPGLATSTTHNLAHMRCPWHLHGHVMTCHHRLGHGHQVSQLADGMQCSLCGGRQC